MGLSGVLNYRKRRKVYQWLTLLKCDEIQPATWVSTISFIDENRPLQDQFYACILKNNLSRLRHLIARQ